MRSNLLSVFAALALFGAQPALAQAPFSIGGGINGYSNQTITGSYTPPFILSALLVAVGPLAFWFIVGELRADE